VVITSEFILSVDIGTSATKAVLYDTDAQPFGLFRTKNPIHVPKGGWSEQEPQEILDSVMNTIRKAAIAVPEGSRLLALSFSSQIYSILAVNSSGDPLTNSLTWFDTRSAQDAELLRGYPTTKDIHLRTGCPVDAIYPLAKIHWMKRNMNLPPGTRFISIKEFILSRLIDNYAVDWSTASASGIFNIHNHQWDGTALAMLGISPQMLSEPVSPRKIFTHWKKGIPASLGIPTDTPLVIGGADGPLASLGVGAHRSNTLAVNVGTSAAARSVIEEPRCDPDGKLWTFVVDEGLWVTGGIVSSGGYVFDWFLKNFFANLDGNLTDKQLEQAHEIAGGLAGNTPPGAQGLHFIPYLGGEQCPGWDPNTRGVFYGLDFSHNREHFARAVLEGITFSIYRVAECIRSTFGIQFEEVYVTGGLSNSIHWLQMAADIFGVPVVVPNSVEGSARGAAMLALIALNERSSYDDFPTLEKKLVQPREETHVQYIDQYQRFLNLVESSKSFRSTQTQEKLT
jgi:gluconokinase